jgi:hypothetical protein
VDFGRSGIDRWAQWRLWMVRGPVVSTGPSVGHEYILLWAWLIRADIDCNGLPWFFYTRVERLINKHLQDRIFISVIMI